MRALLVEDDATIADFIVRGLREAGFVVDHASDGEAGLARAIEAAYDVAIVDLMLPQRDGLSLIEELRRRGIATPVLILSARRSVDDRVRGLQTGGDDYLTKPFAPDEMAARVEVLLRRQRAAERETVLRVGDLELDLIERRARRGAMNLELLPIEFRLLEFLVRNSGQVLTRTMIFEAVWGYHFDPGTNVIDVHIGRLRKKVDPPGLAPLIRTVRGSGYRLAETE